MSDFVNEPCLTQYVLSWYECCIRESYLSNVSIFYMKVASPKRHLLNCAFCFVARRCTRTSANGTQPNFAKREEENGADASRIRWRRIANVNETIEISSLVSRGPKTFYVSNDRGGYTPDFGQAFSNRTYFRAFGQFWLSSVQRAESVAGEKKKKERI